MRSTVIVLILSATIGLFACPASAVIITQVEPDVSLAEATIDITVLYDRIEVDLVKEYKDPVMMECSVVLQFTLEAGDAGKDIWVVHDGGGEAVINNTGVVWTDYHIRLLNAEPGWPQPLPQYAAAAFTNLGNVTSDVFGDPYATGEDNINFAGGPLGDGATATFSGIRITHNGAVNGVFYFKQIPTPEPAALSLLLTGTAIVLLRRKRSR